MPRDGKPVIAYISESNVSDRHAWSGTVHYVYRALVEAGFTVNAVGPDQPRVLRLVMAAANKLSLLFTGLRIDYRHSTAYSEALGKRYTKGLRAVEHDIIVVCGSTESGAYIESPKPIVYVLDRTIHGALNYHEILSRLWGFSMRQSIRTDRKAMQSATLLLFSSEWAAGHAKLHYSMSPSKIRVIPFGANLDIIPAREKALETKDTTTCRLLLIGTSWKNKGADIACRAAEILRSEGFACELTIVGCKPPLGTVLPDQVRVIPFVDKNSEEGRVVLDSLYTSHHFFILPTRFDCTPIVFCEASAYGLPVLTADTGGVAGHVLEGVNGFLLPYSDDGTAYANKISEVLRSNNNYEALRASTRDRFEQALNWRKWSERFGSAIASIATAQGT